MPSYGFVSALSNYEKLRGDNSLKNQVNVYTMKNTCVCIVFDVYDTGSFLSSLRPNLQLLGY